MSVLPNAPPEAVATRYWHRVADGRIQCDVCPRACALRDGQRGLCFVRAAEGGAIVLKTWGRSSGFCVDPIEKKPLNHFLPGTPVLSFGTAGCNLACSFCQNWDISKSRDVDTLADAATPEMLAEAAVQLGCRSVAYTYNDPVIFLEYAVDVAAACRERGVRSVAVSAGYILAEPRAALFGAMDAANIDLKAFTQDFYRRECKGHLDAVKETLEYLVHETGVWVEITTLLIPGANDGDAEIDQLTRWIADRLGPSVPLHLTAFHPDYRMRDRGRTPRETLIRAQRIGRANGLDYVYVGNVLDAARSSTYCKTCGERLIGREHYALGRWHLDAAGRCRSCGTPIDGVIEAAPGDWGRRRQPVRLTARAGAAAAS